MGRYVGGKWHEELPDLTGNGGDRNNTDPVVTSAPAASSSGGGGSAGGGGASDVYQTVNGPKTVDQMRQELFSAGWNGSGTIESAYARTTGGSVSFVGGPSGVSSTGQPGAVTTPGQPPAPDQGANIQAAQLLLNQAQQAAYQAYLNSRLNLDTDQLAFQKAQAAFQNTISEAQVTGAYKGQPTHQAQMDIANLTGTYNGSPTLAAQSEQNKTALGYLGLISNLRGPADYGQYLKVIGSTPGGLKDLVASAAGRYVPATGASTGINPTPVSLGGLIGSLGGNAQSGAAAGAAGWNGEPIQAGIDPATGNPLYQTQNGPKSELQIYNELTANGYTGAQDIASKLKAYAGMGSGGGLMKANAGAGTTYGDYMNTAQGLPAPNQISPAAWNSYTDTQKKLLLGMYEQGGYNPQDVQDLYKQSLPKYAGPAGAGVVQR